MEDYDSMTKQELIYKYIEVKTKLECALEHNKLLLDMQREAAKQSGKLIDDAMKADNIIQK